MKITSAKGVRDSGPLQMMVDVVPDNFFNSASNNKNMLQIIFFSVLFGVALVLSSPKKSKPIKPIKENDHAAAKNQGANCFIFFAQGEHLRV